MKNLIKTLGLTGLIALSVGCKDKIVKETTFSGDNFENSIGNLVYSKKNIQFNVYSVDNWRDYPSAAKPVPRAELIEYESGKKVMDLYFPRR